MRRPPLFNTNSGLEVSVSVVVPEVCAQRESSIIWISAFFFDPGPSPRAGILRPGVCGPDLCALQGDRKFE